MKYLLIFFIFIILSSSAFSSSCEEVFLSSDNKGKVHQDYTGQEGGTRFDTYIGSVPSVLKLLDKNREVRQEYQGQRGLTKFSDEHFGGDMNKAFESASFVLSKEIFKQLNWTISR